jgi:hypothetical protein
MNSRSSTLDHTCEQCHLEPVSSHNVQASRREGRNVAPSCIDLGKIRHFSDISDECSKGMPAELLRGGYSEVAENEISISRNIRACHTV